MTGVRVSAVVPTLDEERNLPYLLPTVAWCDEIVVVDQGSTDGTRELARAAGARVIEVEWRPHFDACRGLGADATTGDWILQLDADEMLPRALAEELRRLAGRPDVDVVGIARLNYFQGRALPAGGLWPDWQYRFFRRGRVELAAEVHGPYKLRSDRVLHLPARAELALHHFHYRGAAHFVGKLNHYTDLEIDKEEVAGAPPGARAFLWIPIKTFLSRYLKHGGWRHGWRGLWLAVFWTFYFFVGAVKRWERRFLPEIQRAEEEQRRQLLAEHRPGPR